MCEKYVEKRGPPDEVIGPRDNPYMERWFIEKAKGPRRECLYLHKISRSDDARALHDHRADNLSLVLAGGYDEYIAPRILGFVQPPGEKRMRFNGRIYDVDAPEFYTRRPGQLVFRRAEQPHRLVLHCDADGKPIPSWSLWKKFEDRRDWGFYPDGKFMPFRDYHAKYGQIQ